MKITSVDIKRFRGFKEQSVVLGSQLTAIAGQNGTQKSTLLGIITQTFTISKDNPMILEKPLCGGNYKSQFADKFRLSPNFDKPKEHEWTLHFDDREDFTVESIERDNGKIRFWKKGSKQKDDGYIQYPVIFLSMKRLIPIAEANVQEEKSLSLTQEEIDWIKEKHDYILITETNIYSTPILSSPEKVSVGVNTDLYDWNQNSMGQDNLGKILLALLSFKRLKKSYPEFYNGGILAIDELDATMYPASQVKLLKILRKEASNLDLQIIFTTHSLSLLEAYQEITNECKLIPETAHQMSLVYLKKCDNNVVAIKNATYQIVLWNLLVMTEGKKDKKKIDVYAEDAETICFAKAILKTKRVKYLNFHSCTLSSCNLIDLSITRKVPAFCKPNSLIILDGDARTNRTLKRSKGANNILLLPGLYSPERMLANFLHSLSEANPLWETLRSGYSKQKCFEEVSYTQIEKDRVCAKKWFKINSEYFGRNATHVINPMLETLKDDVENFKKDFDKQIRDFGIII